MKALLNIQQKLKAPKGQRNTFGKYNYRSAEDILEAVKPLLYENNCILTITDDLVLIGERYYVKATATIIDTETKELIANTAFARESEEKKGMDDSQITGTASSYARKYALNGLFCIDDTKDADTDEYTARTMEEPDGMSEPASDVELKTLKDYAGKLGLDYAVIWRKTGRVKDISKAHVGLAMKMCKDYEDLKQ